MKVLGIIAEYNPFHNGHLYHLKESRSISNADYTVCVMSGDFTQRGEPSLADKWVRSRMAIENGVDLVFELPFVFACNNAEYFAKGGVGLLNSLGCITHLSFGSESGEIDQLSKASTILTSESDDFKQYIKEYLKLGVSYPKARYEAMKKYAGDQCADVLKDANNILGIEYLKQLNILNSNIKPITVKRYGTSYHDRHTKGDIASATAIRVKLQENDFSGISEYIPEATFEILNYLNQCKLLEFPDFYQLLIYKILISKKSDLEKILSVSEGLENKVIKAVSLSKDMNSLIKIIKSKRYTETRIQRMLAHILFDLDKTSFFNIVDEKVMYGRILAFNQKGADLLRLMKVNELPSIPIITNINREVSQDSKLWKLLSYDIAASDIYNLVYYDEIYTHSDYIMKPFKDFS